MKQEKDHVVWIKENPESQKEYMAKTYIFRGGYFYQTTKDNATRYTKSYAQKLAKKGFEDAVECGIESINE